jgi:hypothetical protein
MKLDENVGNEVTIESIAENASQGAIVTVGRTPVYIDGLERWDRAHAGHKVSVTGTLTQEAPDEVYDPKTGEYSTGFAAGRYILESASWKLA